MLRVALVLIAGLLIPPCAIAQTERPSEKGRQGDPDKSKKKRDDEVGFRWKGYPSFELGKGTHVDIRARVQFDLQQSDSPSGETEPAESDLARRRLSVEGLIKNVESATDATWATVKTDTRRSTDEVQAWWARMKENTDRRTDADKDNDGH